MSKTPHIQLYDEYRKYLIDSNIFFVQQAKQKLLSNFSNPSYDADQYENQIRNIYSKNLDPEKYDDADFEDFIFNRGQIFYEDLIKLKEQTQLLIISGMFHSWERNLRAFLTKESINWGIPFKPSIIEFIEKKPISQLLGLLEFLGWNVKSEFFYSDLEACNLVTNSSKHGSGNSLITLASKYPHYIKVKYIDSIKNYSPNIFDDIPIQLEPHSIDIFSQAIVSFWENFPHKIEYQSKNISPPNFLISYLI